MDGYSSDVSYIESDSIRVGRWLREVGFVPASHTGEMLSFLKTDDYIGILYQDPRSKPTVLFGFIKVNPKRTFLGTLFFKPSPWTFKLYGVENKKIALQLAKDLSSKFGHKINVCLESEESVLEQGFVF